MGIVTWIVVGALAGWLGFKLAGDSADRGCLTNIVIGIGGGMIGGSILSIVTGDDYLFPSDLTSIVLSAVASIMGAALLIFSLQKLGNRV